MSDEGLRSAERENRTQDLWIRRVRAGLCPLCGGEPQCWPGKGSVLVCLCCPREHKNGLVHLAVHSVSQDGLVQVEWRSQKSYERSISMIAMKVAPIPALGVYEHEVKVEPDSVAGPVFSYRIPSTTKEAP